MIRSAVFLKSALNPRDFPPANLPEVAVGGRSNVGKSTLINSLLAKGKVARVSRTPGRTQMLNFFLIDNRFRLVDLPGYGYAKVSQTLRQDWGRAMEAYLEERANLRLVMVLADARRGLMPPDEQLLEALRNRAIPSLLILTKTDKLSRQEKAGLERALKEAPALAGGTPWIFSSAITGEGRKEILEAVKKATQPS
jgi:GTP-binding protein